MDVVMIANARKNNNEYQPRSKTWCLGSYIVIVWSTLECFFWLIRTDMCEQARRLVDKEGKQSSIQEMLIGSDHRSVDRQCIVRQIIQVTAPPQWLQQQLKDLGVRLPFGNVPFHAKSPSQ